VICIGFLIYLLVSIYYASVGDTDLELAESSLNYLAENLDAEISEVEIYSPVGGKLGGEVPAIGWFFLSWHSSGLMPASCSIHNWESCLCICKGGLDKRDGAFLERCDKEGFCIESEFSVEGEIKIENPPLVLEIDYENKLIGEKK
jgi:hypothetical protein